MRTNREVRLIRIPDAHIVSEAQERDYFNSVVKSLNEMFADIKNRFTDMAFNCVVTDCVVLESPNGTQWEVRIDDTGALTTTAI